MFKATRSRSLWNSPLEKIESEGVCELLLVVICLMSFRQVPLNASSRLIFPLFVCLPRSRKQA